MHEILSDPVAMRYWSSPPHRTLEESRDWLDSMIHAPAGESDDYIVELEGRVIGKTGCWRLPEIGFIFHPSCWGRGYAREAVAAVVDHLFATTAIPAVTADVDPRNAGSLALLADLGFRETGRASRTWCIAGEWADSIYLALDRPPGTREHPRT
jgi:RimJ/RimL family protein N-acetyltransferase